MISRALIGRTHRWKALIGPRSLAVSIVGFCVHLLLEPIVAGYRADATAVTVTADELRGLNFSSSDTDPC